MAGLAPVLAGFFLSLGYSLSLWLTLFMKISPLTSVLSAVALSAAAAHGAETGAPVKPVQKITPGKVIVPTDAMRRIWGELMSIDLKTRTGTFRKEGTGKRMPFTELPYAELLQHAAFGELQDFRIGVRAIVRMHEAIVSAKMQGNLGKVTVQLDIEGKKLAAPSSARLWLRFPEKTAKETIM